MRILFSSDLHWDIEAYKKYSDILKNDDFDLGILGGDLLTMHKDRLEQEKIIKQILEKAWKKILFLMGNDDWHISNLSEQELQLSDTDFMININMKSVSIDDQIFVWYQYTNPFVWWCFEKTEQQQELDFIYLKWLLNSKIILVTHGPAYGILDRTAWKKNVWSKALLDLINITRPKFHLFGHIHEAAWVFQNSVNGAYARKKKFYIIDTRKHESCEYI